VNWETCFGICSFFARSGEKGKRAFACCYDGAESRKSSSCFCVAASSLPVEGLGVLGKCLQIATISSCYLCLKKTMKCDRCLSGDLSHDPEASFEKCNRHYVSFAKPGQLTCPVKVPLAKYALAAISLRDSGKSRYVVCKEECKLLKCGICRNVCLLFYFLILFLKMSSQKVVYCGAACQNADWKTHKLVCVKKEK
jgi:hypothetical protein